MILSVRFRTIGPQTPCTAVMLSQITCNRLNEEARSLGRAQNWPRITHQISNFVVIEVILSLNL